MSDEPKITDYRAHDYGGKWPNMRCSLSRAVDLDLDEVGPERRLNLEYEARQLGWIEGSLTVKPLEKTKHIEAMPIEIRLRLQQLRIEGGKAFDNNDYELRDIAAYAWHINVREFDLWPMRSTLWRPFTNEDVLAPFDVAEERQYGEFVYDTWIDVCELERYFYNPWLRCYTWLWAGVDDSVKRWTLDSSHQIMPEDTWVMGGLGANQFPTKAFEKLCEPTEWIRSDVRGGAASWNWPASWLMREDDPTVELGEMHIAQHWFSWHELMIRFEELPKIRRAAGVFAQNGMSKAERSCARSLMFRIEKWRERFGPWYTFCQQRWVMEGPHERKLLLV